MNVRKIKGRVDFGIITIREDEFEAVLDRLPKMDVVEAQRRYRIRELPLADGAVYTIAVARCAEQGTGDALNTARDFIEDLRPAFLLVVGIAGGVPADEFTLGDVIVSSRIADFSVEAVLKDHSREYALSGGPLHPDAAKLAADIRAMVRDGDLAGWNDRTSIGIDRPPVVMEEGNFYGDVDWQQNVHAKLKHHFGSGAERLPAVVTGAIASSDRLIKEAETLQVWLKITRQIQAVEMESAGVYKAAHGRVPFLAIRGISDVVGFKRHPDWTRFACHSAAAFMRAFLLTRPIAPRESLRKGTTIRRRTGSQSQNASKTGKHSKEKLKTIASLSFSNEDLLQAAVVGLLRRMPEVGNVRSSQLEGDGNRNIAFEFCGPLGEPILCACIASNKKFAEVEDGTSDVRNLLDRCRETLEARFISGRGESVRVQRVYVMSPHEIPQRLLEGAQDALRRASGELQFVCGASLHELFKKFWPDFLVDEASAIEGYLDRLKADLRTASPLGSLASMYDLPHAPDAQIHTYVQPSFAYSYRIFRVTSRIGSVVPEADELQKEWNNARVRQIQRATQDAKHLVSHLAEWGVVPSPPCPTAADIIDGLNSFAVAVGHAWDEAARKKVEWLPTRPPPRLGDDVKLRLSPELEQRVRPIRTLVKAFDKCIIRELDETASFLSRSCSVTLSNIASAKILRCTALDESLSLAPGSFFETKLYQTIPLGKDLSVSRDISFLLVGPAGYGKTTFCRWNALRDTERLSTDPSQPIPVYVPLHQVARECVDDFDDVFLRRMGLSALLDGKTRSAWRDSTSRIRLYLDGLDEVPDIKKRKEIIGIVQRGLAQRTNVQVIVTARDYVTAPWLTWLPRISLRGLDDSEIRTLASLWFKDPEAEGHFLLELAKTPTLQPTMATPLLATLTILVYKKIKKLPESKVKLYSLFAELLCGGWDLAKGVARGARFGIEVKMQVLTQVAGRLHRRHEKKFDHHEVGVAVRKILSSAREPTIELIANELLMDGLITQTGPLFQFSHLSFQEFFAARSLVGDPQARQLSEVVGSLSDGEDWWKEVFGFYVGLIGDPHALWNWLVRSLRHRSGDSEGLDEDDFLAIIRDTYPDFSS